jgi:WD40 repeat protein
MKNKYAGHTKYINEVRFNSILENVFISASIDGSVRLWDIRNIDVPLVNLKHKSADACDDFKVFGLDWNGP